MALRFLDAALLTPVALFIAWILHYVKRPSIRFPPGPRPLPLIGNMLDIPRDNSHIAYRQWSETYGSDVVHASTFGMEIIVLNSARALDTLFNKRSAIYSERPSMTAFKYIGLGRVLGSLSSGHELRTQRKAYHAHLSQDAVRAYETIQAHAVHNLLRALLDTPVDFRDHLRQMTGEIIMAIAYGIKIREKNDPYIAMAESSIRWISRSLHFDGLILDMVPILQKMPSWFPGAGFKRVSAEGRRVIDETMTKPFQVTKDYVVDLHKGVASSSVLSKMIEEGIDDEFAKNVTASMYMAGADTTASTLASFFLAMVLNPIAQRQAQADLDAIIGGVGSRLPTLSDAPYLPYIDALVDELMRWHPVLPLGMPHTLKGDDIYEGYLIPAGATVFANLHAILHDPALFPDPDAFKPEHFVPRNRGGTLPEDVDVLSLLRDVPFGIGRRICPGRHLARPSTWLAVACTLAVYDILPAKDVDGKDIQVQEKYEDALVSFPAPFRCEIRIRSAAARDLVYASST